MNRIPGLCRAGFVNLLGVSLGERTKRLIFLASFSARIKDQTALDHATLAKLNQVMALCSTEAAMNLPVHLSKVIWRGRSITEIVASGEVLSTNQLPKERLQQLSVRVLSSMPKWLRYAPDAVMREDVAKLLEHRGVLLGA